MADHIIEYINIKNITYQISDPAAEHASGRTTAFPANDSQLSDTKYPSEKLVKTELNKKENLANKITTFDQPVNDTQYPSAKLVRDTIANYELSANKVSAFQTTPDDTHYPTEKLVKDSLDQILSATEGGINSTRTYIVDNLPAAEFALNDANYIVRSGDGGLLYRLDNGAWRLVGGSKVLIQDQLPSSGDSFTDYYVPTDQTKQIYLHYRWADPDVGEVAGHFFAVGTDSYSKSEDDVLLAEKEDLSNKVTSIASTSTNDEYPSALAVYNSLQALQTALEGELEDSTQVVSSVPAAGSADENVNYIVKQGSGALLYRKIDGVMKMVGGAMVSVVNELPTDENDNPLGDEFTDYYVATEDPNLYLHYRWSDTLDDFYAVGADAYSKSFIDSALAGIRSSHTSDISGINTQLGQLGRAIETNASDIEALEGAQKEYSASLTQDGDTYIFSLIENDSDVVSQFPLPATGGGGGGGGGATTMTVERITQTPVSATPTDQVLIEVNFSDVDEDEETVDADYVLKMGSSVVMSGAMTQGRNTFDVTSFCTVGTQRFSLTITDTAGAINVKTWTVQIVDVRIESSFSDRSTNAAGRAVNFTYTPYGAISKTVHFKLDGVELPSVTTSVSGILQSYSIPSQPHGAHLLECWITATVNGESLETTHIFKDIIWYDEESSDPVIGCIYRYDYYGLYETRQYNTTNIPYVVYDPTAANPTVELRVDGNLVSELHLTSPQNIWSFKSDVVAVHTLTITCRNVTVSMRFSITELGYDIQPVTANLNFDFNPTGLSNTSANRLWVDSDNPNVRMTVSENFDWENGGYQVDSEGNQFFLVKSGTRAYFSHNLFGENPKQNGAEFKIIFKSQNVRDKDASFLRCLETTSATIHDEESGEDVVRQINVGLEMQVHEATVHTSVGELVTQYSEEDIIEFEYNINALDTETADATSFIMSYEDGVAARPLMYDDAHRIYQYNAVPITVGSDDCDVLVYRMKSYSSALSDNDILSNFIADARDSESMIARYERNDIYDENNAITPEHLAEKCPDLKIIKISCPHFTTSKTDFIKNTTVQCIHAGGDPVLDNWTFQNGYHAGQGTTSNAYGLAGRNIDIIFGFDGEKSVIVPSSKNNYTFDPNYVTTLTLGDGTRYTDGSGKVSLTRTSVPNDWFNIKVNIASSENANNALLQKRYNDYIPYKTPGQRKNPYAKNSMEFVNCVVFVQENDADLTTHTEFADTDWHFYAIGNLGDSKKTDNTRVNDPEDMKEFVVEISDNTKVNAYFDTGLYRDANGTTTYDPTAGVEIIYPITRSQWTNANNQKRAALYNDWDESFEFRYDMGSKDGETISSEISEAQQEESRQVFRDMYEFVVLSSNADFVNNFGNWFITESPLYWYLFTERYTMMDNRAKNSFWHWGKTYITEAEALEMGDDAQYYTVDNAAAAINNGYRFDLWDYDNDSALGIDNNGELNLTYGYEDIDYDEKGQPVFNAHNSVFWRRIRELMGSQLRAMYNSREGLNCWKAESLINEFDAWQEQFPEELWRLDIERKYLRPYYTGNPLLDLSATDRYLKDMMNGRKKYQRRQFERNQEVYIGTKYFGQNQCSDSSAIMIRCNTPQNATVRPDYTIRVVPYSDMYLSVAYGNSTPQQVRAKAGIEYTFTTAMTTMNDTAILIYCAENIMELNDLSACYIRANNFAYAKRLKVLVIGSTVTGYSNQFITALNMGNNALLERLDIRNCPNLTGSINLTACGNLEEFYAEGTSVSAVSFATNGKLRTAHLPATITSLTLRYLNYLTDLSLAGYGSLESLVNEYGIYDIKTILESAITTLQNVRLVGFNWVSYDTNTLAAIYRMSSSFLSGYYKITGYIRQSEIDGFQTKWPELELDYSTATIIPQQTVIYRNWDGTELATTQVDTGSTPPNPIDAGIITTIPTREADEQYVYTYSGWSGLDTLVYDTTSVYATFDTQLRSYAVSWYLHMGDEPLYSANVTYGSEAVYVGDIPEDHSAELVSGRYRVFKDWDKSTGCVKSDMSVYAVFEEALLPPEGKELKDMTDAERYAVKRNGYAGSYYSLGDYFLVKQGYDPEFSNVESDLLLEDRFFDGTECYDTNIKLFDNDSPSFTIAIDYEYHLSNTNGASLVSCVDTRTNAGFRLNWVRNSTVTNSFSRITWANNQQQRVGYSALRNIIVLRYTKGSQNIMVYSFNGSSSSNYTVYDTNTARNSIVGPTVASHAQTLTFGGTMYNESSGYVIGDRAKGWIYWAKVWYDDLGDDVCKQIANWPRETLKCVFVGSQRHYIAGSNISKADAQFYFANTMPLTRSYGATSGTAPKWSDSSLRSFAHNRVFKSLPKTLQSAIQKVRVATKGGSYTSNMDYSDDYIYLPSIREVYNGNIGSGYFDPEVESGLESSRYIECFTDNFARMQLFLPGLLLEERESATPGRRMFNTSVDPTNGGETLREGDLWYYDSSGYYRVFISPETMEKHSIICGRIISDGTTNTYSGCIPPYDSNNSPGIWVQGTTYYWTRSPYYYTSGSGYQYVRTMKYLFNNYTYNSNSGQYYFTLGFSI